MKKFALAIVVISIQCAVLADLPVITNQPVSQTVSLGASNIILSVSVSNPPVSYQWYMTNCANTGPIPGATNSSYTITNMYAEDLADYMVMVTNVDGTNYSATATLSASCVYTPCDIKAWWQAETNKDFVGHFNATLGTHVSYASGKVYSAFSFDGTANATITCGTSVGNFGTNDFTVEFWENIPAGSGDKCFIGNDPNIATSAQCWQVELGLLDGLGGNSTNLNFFISNDNTGTGYVYSTRNVADGNWHHIACVRSNILGAGVAVMSIYIDGGLDCSQTVGIINPNQTTYNLRIGWDAWFGSYLNGKMDEVALYSRALSSTEITNIFLAGTNGKCCSDPVITTQPSSPTNVKDSSSSPTFTCKFGGTAISYNWLKNGVPLSNGGHYSGATNLATTNVATWPTNAILTISSVDYNDIGTYSVRLSNSCDLIVSDSAYLTAPSWNANGQPTSRTNSVGDNPVFSASASGTKPLKYRWYLNGSPISNATNSTYTVSNVGDANEGQSYTVVITNALSHNYALAITSSPPAVLSVRATILSSITKTPSDGVSCDGANVSLSVSADGPGLLSYQWRRNGANINNATDAAFATNSAATYTVVVSNTHGSDTNAGAGITLNNYPSITTQPASQTINVNDPVAFSVASAGTSRTFQWYQNGTAIAGATKTSYSVDGGQMLDAGSYYVTISNTCSAPGFETSSTAVLTVNDLPLLLFSNKLNGIWTDYFPAEGNALDVSCTNNGTIVNGAGYTNGVVGQGFYLPGTSNRESISFTNGFGHFGTNAFTVDYWLQQPNVTLRGVTFYEAGAGAWWYLGTEFYNTTNVCVRYADFDSSGNDHAVLVNTSVFLNDGAWHHVTASRVGRNYSLIVDGTTTAGTAATTLNINATDLYLGPLAWPFTWPGNLDVQQAVDEIKFGNSNLNWVATQGEAPLRFTNIVETANYNNWGAPSSLLLDTTNSSAAYMVFNDYEANKAPNLDCAQGTLRFWFQPTWNTGDLAAPTNGMLINVGTNAPNNGWWGLVITNNGSTITLNTRTNDGTTTYSTQNLWVNNLTFSSTNWYQIALTFDTNSTALYTNGVLAGTGAGVAYYPSLSERTNGGFSIGSDLSGYKQARGRFDQIDIYNYVQDTNWIYTNYQATIGP